MMGTAGLDGASVGRSNTMKDSGDRSDSRRPGSASVSENRRPSHAPLPAREMEIQRILSVFGSNTRGGYWEPPERLEVLALFGGAKLDFRDANLYSGETIVNCFAMFGGIEIIVPADIEVDANGTGLFGGFEHKALKQRRRGLFGRRSSRDEEHEPFDDDEEPPILKIRGFALFGGVEIKTE